MCPLCSVFLPVILATQISLSAENNAETEFGGRFVPRPAQDQEFPYAVLIKMSRADDGTCSGSLIAMDWVLTAARCMYKDGSIVENDTSLTVYAGVDKQVNDTKHVQNRMSKRMLTHEDNFFSLALVQTVRPFVREQAGKQVGFLPLKIGAWPAQELVCRSGSYGRTQWDVEEPIELKKPLPLIQRCNCSQSLQREFPNVSTEQWVCGEYNGTDLGLCKGGFGATIRCGETFIGVAIDIVTFRPGTCEVAAGGRVSKECGGKTSIDVYADVCYHLEWIHDHVKSLQSVLPKQSECDSFYYSSVPVYSRNFLLFFTSLYFWFLCS